jgi:hypothetical protein
VRLPQVHLPGGPLPPASDLNPDLDPQIVGTGGIFTQAEYNADNEFRKTAAIMKMVVNGSPAPAP